MHNLTTPIELRRPALVHYGSGTLSKLADWVAEGGYKAPFVVADPINAARLDALGLGTVACFGDVVPEPGSDNLDKALELAARSLYAASLVFHAKANDDDDSSESDEPDPTFGFKVSAATRDQLERGKGKLVGTRLSVHDTVLSYIAHFMHAERVRATVFARWHAATYAPGSRAYERVQAAHAATGTIGA